MRVTTLILAASLAACAGEAGSEAGCDPAAPHAERKAACDDGDPRTLDLCLPPGRCAHAAVECDPTDPADVWRAACAEVTGCAEVRCKGDGTCVEAEACK